MLAAMSVERSESTTIDRDIPLAMMAVLVAAILLVVSFLFIEQQDQETAARLQSSVAVSLKI